MARSPDFFRQLNEQLLEQLEEYARQPGRTGDEVHAWLARHKVETSRSAVYRWLQDFRLEDRARRASEVARTYLDAARAGDPHAVTEASLRKFEELIFDHVTSTDETDALELARIGLAMKRGLGSRSDLIELRRKGSEEMEKLADMADRGEITREKILAARKRVFNV